VGNNVKSVSVVSPDADVSKEAVPFQQKAEYITFTVPKLHVYNIVPIEFR